jgi:WD40 repeat protein
MSVQFKHTFPSTECFAIDFCSNEKKPYFGAAFSDGLARIWSLSGLLAGATLDKPDFVVADAVALGPADFKFSPVSNQVAISSMDGSLRVFNFIDNEAKKTSVLVAENTAANAWKLDYSHDGSELLSGQTSLVSFKVYDGLKRSKEYAAVQKYIYSLGYSSDGKLAATGGIDGAVQLFDTAKGSVMSRLENHHMGVRSLKFNCASDSVVSSGEDLHTFVTDLETQQRKQTLVGHSAWVSQISMHPTNHSIFITAGLDKTIKFWSTTQNKETSTVYLDSPVWGAVFSPAGDYIAAATENGTISLINCKMIWQRRE